MVAVRVVPKGAGRVVCRQGHRELARAARRPNLENVIPTWDEQRASALRLVPEACSRAASATLRCCSAMSAPSSASSEHQPSWLELPPAQAPTAGAVFRAASWTAASAAKRHSARHQRTAERDVLPGAIAQQGPLLPPKFDCEVLRKSLDASSSR